MKTTLFIASLLAVPAFAAPDLPERCELRQNLTGNVKPGRGKKTQLKSGAVLEIGEARKRFVQVTVDGTTVWVNKKKLLKICNPVEAEPEPPPVAAQEESEAADEEAAATEPDEAPVTPPPALETPEPAGDESVEIESQITDSRAKIGESRDDEEREGVSKVAIMTLRGSSSMDPEVMQALTDVISQTLDAMGPFASISKQDIEQMLQLEAMKDAVGCDEVSCLAEIGGALGADYLVSGSVLTVGDSYMIQMQLTNIPAAKVEERVRREYSGGAKGLFTEVGTGTKQLVREVLAQKSGTLELVVSQEGATVKLDRNIIGVSPMPPKTIGGGMHTVDIEMEGFVRYSKDVEIVQQKTTRLDVTLLPSAEFKRKYEESANFTRLMAWVSGGVGLAGLATGVVLYGVGIADVSKLKRDIKAYNAQTTHDATTRAKLQNRKESLATRDAIAMVTGCVGVAALATGVALYFFGEDPDRFEDVTTEVGVGVAPGAVSLDFHF